jgi:hypothetical protein
MFTDPLYCYRLAYNGATSMTILSAPSTSPVHPALDRRRHFARGAAPRVKEGNEGNSESASKSGIPEIAQVDSLSARGESVPDLSTWQT